MTQLSITLTAGGLNAMAHADSGGPSLTIAQFGLSNGNFTPSPNMTTLPGQFKTVADVSGIIVASNVVHMTAVDASSDAYVVTAIGLLLADGSLFGIVSLPPVNGALVEFLDKAAAAEALIAVDMVLLDNNAANISFGNTNFLNPPASETIMGVAFVATQAEVDAAQEASKYVTPKTLGVTMAAAITSAVAGVKTWVSAQLASLTATVNGEIATLQSTLATAVNTLNAAMSALHSAVDGEMTALQNWATAQITQIQNSLADDVTTLNAAIATVQSNLNIAIAHLVTPINQQFSALNGATDPANDGSDNQAHVTYLPDGRMQQYGTIITPHGGAATFDPPFSSLPFIIVSCSGTGTYGGGSGATDGWYWDVNETGTGVTVNGGDASNDAYSHSPQVRYAWLAIGKP